ncbi:hypothetical protein C0J52_21514 [Blattella germanica]|nr:hypothetical protein C0J52_21514 [Blattella germanica]
MACSISRYMCLVVLWGLAVLVVYHLRSSEVKDRNAVSPGNSVYSRLLLQKLGDLRTLYTETTATTTHPSPAVLDLEPNIDKSPVPSEAKIVEEVQKNFPSLPIAYWKRHKNKPMFYKNNTCAKYPSIFDLEFSNVYWQNLHTTNGTFQLFGAYYDVRAYSKIGPAVRILGMINRIEPTVKTHCQFWFENQKEPVFSKVMEYKYMWYNKWGNYKQGIYQPYLITCLIPQKFKTIVPSSVSIVEKPCDTSTNNLRIVYNKPKKKKKFAVCVKGLDFLHEDLSVRLVEWIELLGILGADKIFFYELQVHPNISKVLQYYQKLDRVSVTPLTLAGGQPNVPGFQHLYLKAKLTNKRQNELIPYNDCLYKNLYTYEFIALLDIDEIIMPINGMSWHELMDTVLLKAKTENNGSRASYNVRNVYFLDDLIHDHGWFKDIPRYMHMLQHVYRSKNYTKPNQYVKCFHNPERALTLHNHFPLSCLGGACSTYSIDTSDAQLQHYRVDCVRTLKKSCIEYRQNSVIDTTIWKFRDKLIERTSDTLKKLGFFGSRDINPDISSKNSSLKR